jgi:hypothetical protein
MTISPPEIATSSAFTRFRSLRWILIAATVAATVLPSVADAKVAGPYDGVWNVVFATTRGNCSSGASIPFTVTGTRVSSAGGGRVEGSVNRAGGVIVTASVGASRANGRGRLVGSSGSGSWAGIISGDRCSGTWQATHT